MQEELKKQIENCMRHGIRPNTCFIDEHSLKHVQSEGEYAVCGKVRLKVILTVKVGIFVGFLP